MSQKLEQSARFVGNGGRMAALIDVRISQLKRQLEERLAHAKGRADWQEMLEDCDIILHHLEKRQNKANNPTPSDIPHFVDPRAAGDNSARLDR